MYYTALSINILQPVFICKNELAQVQVSILYSANTLHTNYMYSMEMLAIKTEDDIYTCLCYLIGVSSFQVSSTQAAC